MLERRLKLLFFPLALMAIGSLALIPGVATPYIGAFVLILLPGFFLNPNNEPFSGYTIAWHAAVVIFLLWTTGHLFLTGHTLHITLAYQLSFVILYRMLTPKKPRHYQEIWYWCLSSLLLAGFWTTSIVFIGVVAAFTILSVFAFAHTTALREEERQALARAAAHQPQTEAVAEAPHHRGGRRRRPLFAGLVSLGSLALVICAMAVAMFIILPRHGITTLSISKETGATSDTNITLTGLSDYISLGSLGKILEDNTEAMRVTVSPPILDSHGLYLRGGVLDIFDGIHWQKSPYLTRTLNASTARSPQAPAADPAPQPGPGYRVRQKIVYTGLTTNAVFALPNVTRLSLDAPGPFGVNTAGIISMRAPVREFEAVSQPWNPLRPMEVPVMAPLFPAGALEQDDATANPLYLKVPESLQSLTFQHFVGRITGDALSQTEKAMFVDRWLQKNCNYTLDLRGYRSNNPVEEFLYERREGHCELFATAMVMMLRTAGVPARLASGFHGGVAEPEMGPGHFVVRNRDVHTWVEAWAPETGWRTYDPTPPAPLEVFGESLIFLTARQWTEALQRKANHFVFSFSREQQTSLLSSLRQITSPSLTLLWTLDSRGWLPWVMILPAGGVAWWCVWLAGRNRRRAKPRKPRDASKWRRAAAGDAVFLAWVRRQMLRTLGGSVRAMGHDLTLREYALDLAGRRDDGGGRARDAKELAEIYYALRFGAMPLTAELRQDIRRRLEQLKNRS